MASLIPLISEDTILPNATTLNPFLVSVTTEILCVTGKESRQAQAQLGHSVLLGIQYKNKLI
jgi:hypothetical protein